MEQLAYTVQPVPAVSSVSLRLLLTVTLLLVLRLPVPSVSCSLLFPCLRRICVVPQRVNFCLSMCSCYIYSILLCLCGIKISNNVHQSDKVIMDKVFLSINQTRRSYSIIRPSKLKIISQYADDTCVEVWITLHYYATVCMPVTAGLSMLVSPR